MLVLWTVVLARGRGIDHFEFLEGGLSWVQNRSI
jgi:hypothetical protein